MSISPHLPVHASLGQLFPDVISKLKGDDVPVQGLCLDSRKVSPGDLYIALKGKQSNGLDFADEAVANGAVAIVWEKKGRVLPDNVPTLKVKNLRARLGALASKFYSAPSRDIDAIAITGTNGKTSVAHFTSQFLNLAGNKCGSIGTLGYGYGDDLQQTNLTTPDAIQLQKMLAEFRDSGAAAVTMEVSSHALDQGRVNSVEFNTAVFTNLTREHLDYHGDMETYANCKRSLFSWPGLRNAVINADDPFGVELIEDFGRRLDCIAYSVNGPIAGVDNLLASELEVSPKGLGFEVEGYGEKAVVESSLMGIFNAQNLLATLGVLVFRGFNLKAACDALSELKPVPGRMQRLDYGDDYAVIVDFAHTTDALQKALLAVRSHTKKDLVCVFGCGGDRDSGKRSMMGEIAEKYADRVILTNDNPRTEDPAVIIAQILSGMDDPGAALVIEDRREAIACALASLHRGDCLLIAGKGHEAVQIIGDQQLPFNDAEVVAELFAGGAS